MPTEFTVTEKDGKTTVGVLNPDADYLLWQVNEADPGRVYFEYNDQSNGGYDVVREATLMRDGIHIVLDSGKLIHVYFSDVTEKTYCCFVEGLQGLYRGQPEVLEVLD